MVAVVEGGVVGGVRLFGGGAGPVHFEGSGERQGVLALAGLLLHHEAQDRVRLLRAEHDPEHVDEGLAADLPVNEPDYLLREVLEVGPLPVQLEVQRLHHALQGLPREPAQVSPQVAHQLGQQPQRVLGQHGVLVDAELGYYDEGALVAAVVREGLHAVVDQFLEAADLAAPLLQQQGQEALDHPLDVDRLAQDEGLAQEGQTVLDCEGLARVEALVDGLEEAGEDVRTVGGEGLNGGPQEEQGLALLLPGAGEQARDLGQLLLAHGLEHGQTLVADDAVHLNSNRLLNRSLSAQLMIRGEVPVVTIDLDRKDLKDQLADRVSQLEEIYELQNYQIEQLSAINSALQRQLDIERQSRHNESSIGRLRNETLLHQLSDALVMNEQLLKDLEASKQELMKARPPSLNRVYSVSNLVRNHVVQVRLIGIRPISVAKPLARTLHLAPVQHQPRPQVLAPQLPRSVSPRPVAPQSANPYKLRLRESVVETFSPVEFNQHSTAKDRLSLQPTHRTLASQQFPAFKYKEAVPLMSSRDSEQQIDNPYYQMAKSRRSDRLSQRSVRAQLQEEDELPLNPYFGKACSVVSSCSRVSQEFEGRREVSQAVGRFYKGLDSLVQAQNSFAKEANRVEADVDSVIQK